MNSEWRPVEMASSVDLLVLNANWGAVLGWSDAKNDGDDID